MIQVKKCKNISQKEFKALKLMECVSDVYFTRYSPTVKKKCSNFFFEYKNPNISGSLNPENLELFGLFLDLVVILI